MKSPKPSEDSLQPNMLAAGMPAGLSWRLWLVTAATGVAAGVGGGLLMLLLHAVEHLAWQYTSGQFLTAVERTAAYRRIGVLVSAGLIAGLAQFVLARGPGGHAGELAESIWFKRGEMPFFHTMGKAVVSVVTVAMGASLGREAAPKQVGSVFGAIFAKWSRLSDAEQRLVCACGAGAGIAAVYNVPLGGALFSLEILLGSLAVALIPPALLASVVATWTAWQFLPDTPTYHLPNYAINYPQIVWAALAGPFIGLWAILYTKAISWADAEKPSSWVVTISPFLVFAALGLLAIPYPQLLGNGKDTVQDAFLGTMPILLLLPLLFLKPLATSACLGSGSPGGLFTPTATCGALLGGVLGWCWHLMFPAAPLGSYAVIGAGAFLAAAMQAPLASFVLVMELTGSGQALMVPLMFATLGASVISRRLEPRSIYSGRIHKGLGATNVRGIRTGTEFDDLLRHDFEVISTAARYAETLKRSVEASDERQSLYVVDAKGALKGIIPRDFADICRPTALEVAIGTAGDFATKADCVPRDAARSVAESALKAAASGKVAVVDRKTERFLGEIGGR